MSWRALGREQLLYRMMSLKPNTLRGEGGDMDGINSLEPAASPSPQRWAVSRMGAKQEPCRLQTIPGDVGTRGGGAHVEGDTCGTTHRAQMVGGGKTPCTKGA